MTWVDVLVGLTLCLGFWGGYRCGFVRELGGVLAIVGGWWMAARFAGPLAESLGRRWHLSAPVAHLAALWSLFLGFFAAIRIGGVFLERFAALPVCATLSGLGGGLVGACKSIALMWLALFIALFFPMNADVRNALRKSPSVAALEALDRPAVAAIEAALPKRVRPLGVIVLRHHRL